MHTKKSASKSYTFIVLSLLTTITLLFGCSDNSVEGTLSAQIQGDQLLLSNSSDDDIFYFAIDERTLAVIDWAPIVSEDSPKVESGQTLRISLTEITGYSPETEVIVVSYWNAIEVNGQLEAGPVNTLTLRL